MGMFDDVDVDGRKGQIKTFRCMMICYEKGDSCGAIDKERDYDIAMREGGFLHVRDCRITGWDDTNDTTVPTFDKWGGKWDGEGIGNDEVGQALMELEGTPPKYHFN